MNYTLTPEKTNWGLKANGYTWHPSAQRGGEANVSRHAIVHKTDANSRTLRY